jgi:hypothetical protein
LRAGDGQAARLALAIAQEIGLNRFAGPAFRTNIPSRDQPSLWPRLGSRPEGASVPVQGPRPARLCADGGLAFSLPITAAADPRRRMLSPPPNRTIPDVVFGPRASPPKANFMARPPHCG